MIKPRTVLAGALALGLAAALGGCGGFTPMYAAPGVTPRLAAIEVVQPDGRTGFLLRQALDDALGRQQGEPAAYRLTVATSEVRAPRGIRVNNVASRYEVNLTTTYNLYQIATGQLVTSGRTTVNVTYDLADQPYAGVMAQQDGERRVAEQAADRIRLELASFFASPRPTPNATAVTAPNLATYSERTAPAVIQSPRERALGQPQPRAGQADVLGQPGQTTVAPGQETQPFSPSQDPNAIQTLPLTGGTGQ